MSHWVIRALAESLDRVARWGGRPGQVLVDALVVGLAFLVAFQLRFEFSVPSPYWKAMVLWLPYTILAHLATNFVFGVYRILWRYISLYEVWRFVKAVGC
ncbi:MAG: hypothetical protein QXW06_02715, partial [Thermoplasmata archaeon]